MAHIIAEPCIGTKDAACVEVCPVDCIDCGLCVDECPVHAIYPQEDLPAEWKQYIQINSDFFKNRK